MKTYEQAKEEMIFQVNNLQDVIKFLRENAYYEKICGSCSTKMRLRVNDFRANERKFCNDACRATNQRDKKRLGTYSRQELNKRKQKRDEIKKEIIKLRNKGLTFAKIGTKFNISRQRVEQIYSKMTKNDS